MNIEKDVSTEAEFKNHRGNPFRWSESEIWHDGKAIGVNYCGDIEIWEPGYRFTLEQKGERTKRLTIYRTMDEDDWKAADFVKQFKKEP